MYSDSSFVNSMIWSISALHFSLFFDASLSLNFLKLSDTSWICWVSSYAFWSSYAVNSSDSCSLVWTLLLLTFWMQLLTIS